MAVIFEEWIAERVATHQAWEAARNSPAAVARRAVYTLAALVADMSDADACMVLTLLDDEVMEPLAARASVLAGWTTEEAG